MKAGRPLLRPGGEQADLPPVALHQHPLEGNHGNGALALIGRPVEVRPPECGEARLVHGLSNQALPGGVFGDIPAGLVGQPQHSRLDGILPPAAGLLDAPPLPRLQRDIEIGFADRVGPVRKHRIQLGVFGIFAVRIGARRLDPLFAAFFAKR